MVFWFPALAFCKAFFCSCQQLQVLPRTGGPFRKGWVENDAVLLCLLCGGPLGILEKESAKETSTSPKSICAARLCVAGELGG